MNFVRRATWGTDSEGQAGQWLHGRSAPARSIEPLCRAPSPLYCTVRFYSSLRFVYLACSPLILAFPLPRGLPCWTTACFGCWVAAQEHLPGIGGHVFRVSCCVSCCAILIAARSG